MKWQAVFLDFDGVIIDSVDIKTNAFAEMFRPYGSDIEAKVVEYHLAHGGVSRFEKFKYYYERLLNRSIDETQIQQLGNQFSELVLIKVLEAPFVDGAFETLMKLKALNIPTYLVTGTPQEEIQYILKMRGLEDFFSGVYGAPAKKEHIVHSIIKQSHYSPDACLYVGDALTDYSAAQQNGLHFSGIVPCGAKSLFPDSIKVSSKVTIEL